MSDFLFRLGVSALQNRVQELEAVSKDLQTRLDCANREALSATLRANASEKLRQGGHLSRPEVAAHLGISTRKLQRMEAAGKISRCPGLGATVRYAARDVLRLAQGR